MLLAVLFAAVPGVVHGQSAPMTVVVQSDGDLALETFGSIAVSADGTECAAADIAAGTRSVSLTIGTAEQPEACRTAGATLTFVVGSGSTLVTEAAFEAGSTFVLDNLAPPPPAAGGPGATPNQPVPASTGNSGLASSGASLTSTTLMALSALAVLIALAAVRGLLGGRRR